MGLSQNELQEQTEMAYSRRFAEQVRPAAPDRLVN